MAQVNHVNSHKIVLARDFKIDSHEIVLVRELPWIKVCLQ